MARIVVEMRAKSRQSDDPARQAALDRLIAAMEGGLPGLAGSASYEERTAR